MWSKYVTRRLAVQVAQAWNFGWGKAMQKIYGLQVPSTLVFYDGKKTEYYVDLKQHQKYVAGLYKLLGNKKFISSFHSRAQLKLEQILGEIRRIVSVNLSGISNQKLADLYQDQILPRQTQFYVRMWTVFNIGEPLANVVRSSLEQKHLLLEKTGKYLLALSSPLVPNDVMRERTDILKIALNKKHLSSTELQRLIKLHTQKYRHIPVYDIDHQPYAEKHFLKELVQIKKPRQELEKIKRAFLAKTKEFRNILKALKPSRELKALLFFLKDNVVLRDHRDKIRQQLNMELKKLYTEIGRRLKLNLYQATLLTDEEIIRHLKNEATFDSSEISKREKSFLLIQKNAKANLFSGKTALETAKKELGRAKGKTSGIIKGTTGSAGYARGTVKILYTNKDLNKVKPGDIIVATMTRQDFITAIRKAKALVTDEGSITAHAAIIARELGIPCVVATKVATKILKDGDLVEVDANQGIVRKLN